MRLCAGITSSLKMVGHDGATGRIPQQGAASMGMAKPRRMMKAIVSD